MVVLRIRLSSLGCCVLPMSGGLACALRQFAGARQLPPPGPTRSCRRIELPDADQRGAQNRLQLAFVQMSPASFRLMIVKRTHFPALRTRPLLIRSANELNQNLTLLRLQVDTIHAPWRLLCLISASTVPDLATAHYQALSTTILDGPCVLFSRKGDYLGLSLCAPQR